MLKFQILKQKQRVLTLKNLKFGFDLKFRIKNLKFLCIPRFLKSPPSCLLSLC